MGLGSREAEHTRDGRVFFFRERSEQTRSVRELGRGDELGRSTYREKISPAKSTVCSVQVTVYRFFETK